MARDPKIAELAARNFMARRALLMNGDPRTVSDIANSVLEYLAERHINRLVQLALSEPKVAGAEFSTLVVKVMKNEAEADAIGDVEQMEKDRAADEARVERQAGPIHRAVIPPTDRSNDANDSPPGQAERRRPALAPTARALCGQLQGTGLPGARAGAAR